MIFALARFLDPLTFRLTALDRRLKRDKSFVWGLGPLIFSPVERVAMVVIPKSTPTGGLLGMAGLGISVVSTAMLTNQRSATREMTADTIFPMNRRDSRIRIHPRWGIRI